MYSIANWNPPPECCRLLAEGRKYAYCKKFDEAIHLFKKSIETHSNQLVATTAYRPPWCRDIIIAAARLFLMKVCWSNKDAAGAQEQAQKLQQLAPKISNEKMMVHCCWAVAQVCRSLAEKSSVPVKTRQLTLTGVSACRSVLPHRALLRHFHERARFLELESQLHALNCTCVKLECRCGSYGLATRRLEECIECHAKADRGSTSAMLSKAKRHSKQNFCAKPKACDHQWKQPHKPTALMRQRLDKLNKFLSRLPVAVKRARENETEAAQEAEKANIEKAEISREQGRKRKKKKRFKLANCLNAKLQEFGPRVRARLRFVDGMCKRRKRMDWDAVPPSLRPSSSGAGGLAPARAARKRNQLESLFTVLLRLIACTEAHQCRAPALPETTPTAAASQKAEAVSPHSPVHVVDFGAGSGNSLLPLVSLLKHRSYIHAPSSLPASVLSPSHPFRTACPCPHWFLSRVRRTPPLPLSAFMSGASCHTTFAAELALDRAFVLVGADVASHSWIRTHGAWCVRSTDRPGQWDA